MRRSVRPGHAMVSSVGSACRTIPLFVRGRSKRIGITTRAISLSPLSTVTGGSCGTTDDEVLWNRSAWQSIRDGILDFSSRGRARLSNQYVNAALRAPTWRLEIWSTIRVSVTAAGIFNLGDLASGFGIYEENSLSAPSNRALFAVSSGDLLTLPIFAFPRRTCFC